MLLWVNLHGGYVVGFFLIGVYFMGNLAKYIFSPEKDRQISRTKVFHLGYAGVASLILALFNPFGYQILLFPFHLVSDKYMMDHVMEFMSPNFHNPYYFKYLLLVTVALFAVSDKKLNIIELVLVVFFVNMSLYSTRYIPLFSIFAAPIILRQADSLIEKTDTVLLRRLKESSERISLLDASTRGFNWPILAIAIAVFLAVNGKIGYSFEEKIKPVAAVNFIQKEHISGNMYNNDEFGDYIIYKAYPHYKVFIDGRLDMYGSERLKEYFKVCDIKNDWENVLQKYNIDWIFFNTDSILTRHLLCNNNWKLIYSDKVASIFVKNIPKHQQLIAKYPDVKPAAIEEEKDASNRN